MKTFTVSVHTTDGQRHQYSADNGEVAREHAAAIVKNGYMAQRLNTSVFYGPSSILRVETFPIPQLKNRIKKPNERYAKKREQEASARSIAAAKKEVEDQRCNESKKNLQRQGYKRLWREMQKEIKNK